MFFENNLFVSRLLREVADAEMLDVHFRWWVFLILKLFNFQASDSCLESLFVHNLFLVFVSPSIRIRSHLNQGIYNTEYWQGWANLALTSWCNNTFNHTRVDHAVDMLILRLKTEKKIILTIWITSIHRWILLGR